MSGTYRYFQIISVSGSILLSLLAFLSFLGYESLGIKNRLSSGISLVVSAIFYLILAIYSTHVINKREFNIEEQYRRELAEQDRTEVVPLLN